MTKEELYEQFEELVRTYIADNSDLSDEELIKTINVDYNNRLFVPVTDDFNPVCIVANVKFNIKI